MRLRGAVSPNCFEGRAQSPPTAVIALKTQKNEIFFKEVQNSKVQSTFISIEKWLLSTILFKRIYGGESWDLFSNQQMDLEIKKNLGLIIFTGVDGG